MMPAANIVEVEIPEQIDQIRLLFRDYQTQLLAEYRFRDDEWLNLPGEYASPRGALLLAIVGDQPAGCVGLRPFPITGTCEMKRLYVRPSFRGNRLGKTLVEHMIEVARRLDYSRLRLDTHPQSMQAAVELYRRFGFEEVTDEVVPRTTGLSYMELLL